MKQDCPTDDPNQRRDWSSYAARAAGRDCTTMKKDPFKKKLPPFNLQDHLNAPITRAEMEQAKYGGLCDDLYAIMRERRERAARIERYRKQDRRKKS